MMSIARIGLFFLIIMSASISCKKEGGQVEREHIETMLKDLGIQSGMELVIILPGLGCHGCIQEGEYFLKEHLNNPNLFLVLTNIESLKILQHKLDIKIDTIPNIYRDSENKYSLPTNNNIYPCIVHLKNGLYSTHEFQSPENGDAFERLSAQLLIK